MTKNATGDILPKLLEADVNCATDLQTEYDTETASKKKVVQWLKNLPDDNQWFEIEDKKEPTFATPHMWVKKATDPTRNLKSILTNPSDKHKEDTRLEKVPVATEERNKTRTIITRGKKSDKESEDDLDATKKSKKKNTLKRKLKKCPTVLRVCHSYNTKSAAALNKEVKKKLNLVSKNAQKRRHSDEISEPTVKKFKLDAPP